MTLINTKCPECHLDYPTSDQISKFKWYCSDECEEIARDRKRRTEHTIPDAVIAVEPEDTEEVYDSTIFKL